MNLIREETRDRDAVSRTAPLAPFPKLKQLWARLTTAYAVVAIILFSTFLLFVALNLILMVVFYFRGPEPGTLRLPNYSEAALRVVYPDLGRAEREELLRETWLRTFDYEDFVLFKERPFRGKYVNVNEAGFRISPNQGPWPMEPTNLNIFVFGGSTSFGYGLPDSQTVPAYLQQALSDVVARRVCVYNFGAGWYYSTQERVLFERLFTAGHRPDIIVFIDGLNDCFHWDDRPQFSERASTIFTKDRSGGLHSLVGRMPIGRAIRAVDRRIAKPTLPPSELEIRANLERYVSKKGLIEAICKQFGILPLFVWQPIADYNYDLKYHLFANPGDDTKRQSFVYSEMANMYQAGLLGENFLWCADMQQNDKECLYVDRHHYTAKFANRFANAIAGAIKDKQLLQHARAPQSLSQTPITARE